MWPYRPVPSWCSGSGLWVVTVVVKLCEADLVCVCVCVRARRMLPVKEIVFVFHIIVCVCMMMMMMQVYSGQINASSGAVKQDGCSECLADVFNQISTHTHTRTQTCLLQCH